MADPPAVRMRRSRLHKRDDHSECVPGRCAELDAFIAVGGQVAVPSAAPLPNRPRAAPKPPPGNGRRPAQPEPDGDEGPRVPGETEADTIAFVEALPYRAPDPRAMLARLAVRLARRIDETGAMPAAIRELRVLLVQLVEVPNGEAGPVDELRLRAAQRRFDMILANKR